MPSFATSSESDSEQETDVSSSSTVHQNFSTHIYAPSFVQCRTDHNIPSVPGREIVAPTFLLGPGRIDADVQWEYELRNLDSHASRVKLEEQAKPNASKEQLPQSSLGVWRTEGAIGNGLF
ncbi:hypothetical protein CVT25_004956 [Psilocybe cyanescens]|uniref:Uncharacterized protein n=1 Tax=Psilocybe cyanescens TaxID=93625 RepID=A0A409XU91_PSICY|nr:hypothetical protein CVT25_004956 [Psilocybe cyanescens]